MSNLSKCVSQRLAINRGWLISCKTCKRYFVSVLSIIVLGIAILIVTKYINKTKSDTNVILCLSRERKSITLICTFDISAQSFGHLFVQHGETQCFQDTANMGGGWGVLNIYCRVKRKYRQSKFSFVN